MQRIAESALGYTFPCRMRASHSGNTLSFGPTPGVTLTVTADPELPFAAHRILDGGYIEAGQHWSNRPMVNGYDSARTLTVAD